MTLIRIPKSGSKIGFNNNIGTSSFVILSNATVTNPIGEQAKIVSTSVQDSSTGTGIQKVRIRYFDNNWILNDEIVTMNGTSPVNTEAIDILRIETFEAFQAGSDSLSVGTITLKSTDETRLFAQIDPNNSIFNRALHFVSPGKTCEITDITADCSTTGGLIFQIFETTDNTPDGGGPVLIPSVSFILANNTERISLNTPIRCDASRSTQGIQVGILVKGLAASQIGIASFHFNEL